MRRGTRLLHYGGSWCYENVELVEPSGVGVAAIMHVYDFEQPDPVALTSYPEIAGVTRLRACTDTGRQAHLEPMHLTKVPKYIISVMTYPGDELIHMAACGCVFVRHQWSSGRIHRCHRCDPGSIPG